MSSARGVKVGIVASHLITALSSAVHSSSPLLTSCYQSKLGDTLCQAGLIGIHVIHWLHQLCHITTIYTTKLISLVSPLPLLSQSIEAALVEG